MTYKNRSALVEENAKLRAEIDNLQAGRSAPTILEVLDEPGFERMTEMFPDGFRESGTPVRPTDSAMEVFWSMVRYADRTSRSEAEWIHQARKAIVQLEREKIELKRARHALAEYAMRAVEPEPIGDAEVEI